MLGFATLLLASRLIAVPDASAGPAKQPQLAASGNTVVMTFGSANRVWFARSDDGGATFTPAVKVADLPGLMLGKRRGPRIAIAGSRVLVTAIGGGNLLLWTSDDKGATWSSPRTINDAPNAAREGFEALSASPDGKTVMITWLDLRSQAMKLYGTLSKDAGRTWDDNRLVYASPDGHICECCHTSSAVGNDGSLYVMWRNWLGGSRDMYLAKSTDSGRTWKEQKLGEGTWPLNGCPMDGGSLQVGADGSVTTAWRRDKTVYLSIPGQPERELGPGTQPVLATTPKGIVAVWSEGGVLKLLPPGASEPRVLAPSGAFATLAGPVAAWEEDGKIVVDRIGIR